MITAFPHHDSKAFLEVAENPRYPGKYGSTVNGWCVRRKCPCHKGVIVSIPFATRAEAERCLRALDEPRNRGPI